MNQAACIVCGLAINENRYAHHASIFRHNRQWRHFEHNLGSVFMNAEEIESQYFPQTRGFWLGLYRLSAW